MLLSTYCWEPEHLLLGTRALTAGNQSNYCWEPEHLILGTKQAMLVNARSRFFPLLQQIKLVLLSPPFPPACLKYNNYCPEKQKHIKKCFCCYITT